MRLLLPAIFLTLSLSLNSGAVGFTEKIWEEGSGGGKRNVTLSAHIPADGSGSGTAVIICPGGSYFWLADKDEGEDVAQWFCRHGVAAFVLSYRVAGKLNFITDTRFVFDGNQYPAMLEDALHAIRVVRSKSEEYGINRNRIGIMGFSAGGHLAMLTAEKGTGEECPDFAAMLYPVVTMSDSDLVHKRSRRGLMGRNKDNESLRDSLSLEKNIPSGCCPVFIMNCRDDNVVDYRNSELMDSALTAKGIVHKYIQNPTGGHGFGIKPLYRNGMEFEWPDEFLVWLTEVLHPGKAVAPYTSDEQ